jgi:serine/threonine protein kinase
MSQELASFENNGIMSENPWDAYDILGKHHPGGIRGECHIVAHDSYYNVVAIKQVPASGRDKPTEICALVACKGKNIIQQFGFFNTGGEYYSIQEHLDGGSLDSLISCTTLLERDMAIICREVIID